MPATQEVTPAVASINRAIKATDELQTLLNTTPPCENPQAGRSCLFHERSRGLRGGVRPFRKYDEAKLCSACSATWHVALAALALQDARRRALEIAAETAAAVG